MGEGPVRDVTEQAMGRPADPLEDGSTFLIEELGIRGRIIAPPFLAIRDWEAIAWRS